MITENYEQSWEYVKETRNQIFFVLGVFLASALLALFYQPPEVIEMIKEFLRELIEKTAGLNAWQMIVFILNNNLSSSFFSMLLGVFFGVFPVLSAFSNGYVLGYVISEVMVIEGISSLWRLLPHGVFEFPAIILSLALGIKLGFFWQVRKGRRKAEFIRRLKQSIVTFFLIVLPLLITAAIIEGLLIILLS